MNITQVRRVVFRKKNGSGWSTLNFEADDLGQDTIMSVNISPRLRARNSAMGSTETPIKGTLGAFAGSITFLMDTYEKLGKAIDNWTASTYTGHSATAGQIVGGTATPNCDDSYFSVIAQGLCDDGSEADVELTRCQPSVDDDLEFGTGDTPTVTLNLHPIIYNPTLHGSDGYPAQSYRFGDYSTTSKQRLNASTGVYATVS